MAGELKKVCTKLLSKRCLVGLGTATALMTMASMPAPASPTSFGLPSRSLAALNRPYVNGMPVAEANRSKVLLADAFDDSDAWDFVWDYSPPSGGGWTVQ
jgi:hypothetical protein